MRMADAARMGAAATRRRGQRPPAGGELSVVAFFVTARDRAPLLPLLALFAAAGVRWAIVEASVRARATDGVVATAVYLVSNVGQGAMPLQMNADAEQGLAHWLEREGRRL